MIWCLLILLLSASVINKKVFIITINSQKMHRKYKIYPTVLGLMKDVKIELQKLSQLPAIHWQRRCSIICALCFNQNFSLSRNRVWSAWADRESYLSLADGAFTRIYPRVQPCPYWVGLVSLFTGWLQGFTHNESHTEKFCQSTQEYEFQARFLG